MLTTSTDDNLRTAYGSSCPGGFVVRIEDGNHLSLHKVREGIAPTLIRVSAS